VCVCVCVCVHVHVHTQYHMLIFTAKNERKTDEGSLPTCT